MEIKQVIYKLVVCFLLIYPCEAVEVSIPTSIDTQEQLLSFIDDVQTAMFECADEHPSAEYPDEVYEILVDGKPDHEFDMLTLACAWLKCHTALNKLIHIARGKSSIEDVITINQDELWNTITRLLSYEREKYPI